MKRTSAVSAMGALTLVALLVSALTTGLPMTGAGAATVPAVLHVEPSKDAYTLSNQPDQSFGTDTRLRTDGSPRIVSYLSFPRSTIPGTITKVTLEVFATSRSNTGYDVYAVADGAWTEAGLIDINKPSLGSRLGGSGKFAQNSWTTVDMTAPFMATGNLNFALVGLDSTNVTYASRESSVNRPRITFEYHLDTSTPPATPDGVVRAAFYYPWFPQTWGKYSTDPFTVYHPALGYYSSDDPAILKKHFDALRYANMNSAVVSWWGPNKQSESTRIPLILSSAADAGLRVALYYEKEGFGDPNVRELFSDLDYMLQRYATSGQYLTRNGKPVVLVFGDRADNCDMVRRWQQANGGRFFIVLKVFTGYRACAQQPDGWHQYGPGAAQDHQTGQSFTISPGFWLKGERTPRLSRDPSRWATNIRNMVASGEPFQLVTTFNEWGEGTAVEAADRMADGSAGGWASPSGYGRYIDLLHENIPAPTRPPSPTATPSMTTTSSTTLTGSATSGPSSTTAASTTRTTTSAAGGSSITVAAAGDVSCEPGPTLDPSVRCAEPLTADTVVDMNPSGVLALGDLQYTDGALSSFHSEYDPAWGRFKNKTYPAPGNHEWLTTNAQGYRDYFSSGVPPEVDVQRLYYSFNLGAWHFISLDSDCKGSGGCSAIGAQTAWLKADLVANDGRPTVVYWHHPRYTSDVRGDNTSMSATWNVLAGDRDVQLALAGHTHHYERFAPMGTSGPDPAGLREFVVGSGGRNHVCPPATRRAGSQVTDCTTFGVLKLTLNGDGSYGWEFVPAAGTGTFTDRGSQPRR